MRTRITIATLFAIAVAVFGPTAAFAGSDPVSTLQADLTTLTGAVTAAHSGLLADLTKITTDAGNLQGTSDRSVARAAMKADLKQFLTDRSALLDPVKAARTQVKADLQAAKDAKADRSAIKPLLQAARSENKAALDEVREAAKQARDAIKALVQSFKTH